MHAPYRQTGRTCTKQQEPVSTLWGLKKVPTSTRNIKSICLLLMNSLRLATFLQDAISGTAPSSHNAAVCIRCILLALRDLHAAKFAHTDIRWPNVIKCSNEAFRLIDLETAVILRFKWNVRHHGLHRVGCRNDTLTQGRYTADSDLALKGHLLTEPGLPPLEESGLRS